ncbi:MAG TPA: thiomuracin/GE37468 family thiazolyl RiPP peptide [Streptosporangiaceae bacterium]|nr:thiomuracin/GE37468 family thiazolyl RiPP peptide [Streptosporangiaceae bacterium]
MSTSLAFDLEELAADVFEIDASGLAVESLTGGHGMTEVAGSCASFCSSSCCCCTVS